MIDDELELFDSGGPPPLPAAADGGYVDHDGARIWYASYGAGSPVVLLHGGLGHSGNWGYQVPDLVAAGHRVVVIDSRGHGRSSRDARPYSYDLMATDVLAVLDQRGARRLERRCDRLVDHGGQLGRPCLRRVFLRVQDGPQR